MNLNDLNKMDDFFMKQSQSKQSDAPNQFSPNKEVAAQKSVSKDKKEYVTGGDFFRENSEGKKYKNVTKTKWDTFSPYAFIRLSDNQKKQNFLQLFDDYQAIKIKLNQEQDKHKKTQSKLHYLEGQIVRLKSIGNLPASDKLKLEKEHNQEVRDLKEEIRRLHEKIVALTGNKLKFTPNSRPKSAVKPQKAIFPANENYKSELEMERKHVKQLLLIIDELKNNKYSLQNQLKEKQQNQSLVRPRKGGKVENTQSQFQGYAYDLQNWKEKYNDLQLIYNKMREDKDKRIKQLEVENLQLHEDQRIRRTANTFNTGNTISINLMQEKNRSLQDQMDKLEQEIRRLVAMPFNQNNKSAIDLQEKYTKMEIAFQKTKEELAKTRENSNKYFTELEYKTRESNLLRTDNEKLKKQIKEHFQKQNPKDKDIEINYDDYYRKLMNIVKLEGNDPVWRKYANMAMPSFETMTEDQLKVQCESFWRSKLELLAHLEKAQVQLSTIKQSNESRIGLYLKDKDYLQEELRIAKARLDEWVSMQKVSVQRETKLFEWGGIKYDDSVSVFDADEKQLKDLDSASNYFDLYLGMLNIDQNSLLKIPQNKIKNINSMISFVTIDFYNHDTQHSNFLEGNSKKFDNNYSFKVEVNSYFIKFMSKNALSLELWSPQGTNTILIGKAQIWLRDILANSVKDISAVVRGKCPIYHQGKTMIGTVEYRMRMRLPISPFLEWTQTKEEIKLGPKHDYLKLSQRKRLSITIARATNLQTNCNAFVYFSLQNQDYFTEPAKGPSPLWDYHQEIDILMNEEFEDELKQNYVQFTIFDDEKEVSEDVIGTAKANLTKLLDEATTLALDLDIKNKSSETIGKLKVQFHWM